jgi:hypothetical protein
MSRTFETHGVTKEMEGKRLRICFVDGEIAEIKLNTVMLHDCHEDCNGFILYLVSTNQTQKYEKSTFAEARWGHFQDVSSIEQLGD